MYLYSFFRVFIKRGKGRVECRLKLFFSLYFCTMLRRIINSSCTVSFIACLLTSCSNPELHVLRQKWKTIQLVNRKMENEFAAMQHYIDTLGNQSDSLKQSGRLKEIKDSLQQEWNEMKENTRIARENTFMEFATNGVIYMTSLEGRDSAFYTVEKNEIKIDEARLKGHGETMTFYIQKLTPDTLKLRFVDYGDTSDMVMISVHE